MASASEERPAVWVGHVVIPASDVKASTRYWIEVGMRSVVEQDEFAVLELRGGTHLVVAKAEAPIAPDTPAPFDVMVEDVNEAHERYTKLGFEPSALDVGRIHTSFTMRDPSGHLVTVNSSHVVGVV